MAIRWSSLSESLTRPSKAISTPRIAALRGTTPDRWPASSWSTNWTTGKARPANQEHLESRRLVEEASKRLVTLTDAGSASNVGFGNRLPIERQSTAPMHSACVARKIPERLAEIGLVDELNRWAQSSFASREHVDRPQRARESRFSR